MSRQDSGSDTHGGSDSENTTPDQTHPVPAMLVQKAPSDTLVRALPAGKDDREVTVACALQKTHKLDDISIGDCRAGYYDTPQSVMFPTLALVEGLADGLPLTDNQVKVSSEERVVQLCQLNKNPTEPHPLHAFARHPGTSWCPPLSA